LFPQAKKKIKEKVLIDNKYWMICQDHTSGNTLDKEYKIKEDVLSFKN